MISRLIQNIKGSTIGGVLLVVSGNIALLFSKTLVWLLVPRMLGVTEYGYYKTFTLYLVYALLLHFGFPDGVLLIHAGQKYEAVSKEKFRTNSRFFITFQFLISFLIVGTSFLFFNGMNCYIFCMIGIDAFLVNVSTYYKFVSQAVMRFKELTIRNVIQAVLQIVSLLLILALSKWNVVPANGYIYIFSVIMTDAVLVVWYMITYRDITFGQAVCLSEQRAEIGKYFSVGILLTVAFQVSHFVFVLDSQMVEILFDIETYSLYAFAYSITNMISLVISAVATVMLPSLKRLEERNAMSKFSDLMGVISVIVFFLVTAYYPLVFFIKWYLPDYAGALSYLKIILPGLAVSSCINWVIFTYYKVMNQLKRYLGISVVILLVGGGLNWAGYTIFHTPSAFSVASIVTLLLWYLLSEQYFVRTFKVKWLKNFFYICMELAVFYVINIWVEKEWKAMFLYLLCYLAVTFLFYKDEVKKYEHSIHSRKGRE